jgi:hypothetical protein
MQPLFLQYVMINLFSFTNTTTFPETGHSVQVIIKFLQLPLDASKKPKCQNVQE